MSFDSFVDDICDSCLELLTKSESEKKKLISEYWKLRDARIQLEDEVRQKREEAELYSKQLQESKDELLRMQDEKIGLEAEQKDMRASQIRFRAQETRLNTREGNLRVRAKSLETRSRKLGAAERHAEQLRRDAQKRQTTANRQAEKAKRALIKAGENEKKLKSLETRLVRKAKALEAGEARLEKKIRAIPASVKQLDSELQKTKRSLERAKGQAARLRAELLEWESLDTLLEWLGAGLGQSNLWPYEESVVVLGDGPYSKAEMRRHLKGAGFLLSRVGSEESRILIVGKENWAEDGLYKQIQARQGKELKIYSQEMFLLASAVARDPFVECDEDELIELFGGGHPALEFLIYSDLAWPSTIPTRLTDGIREKWGVDESPLHKIGYHVGVSSELTESERRQKLKQAFTVKELPYVHSEDYMRFWGGPASPRRLWRMAHHLAQLARKHDPRKRVAESHWTDDLKWMKKQFFKPWMEFRWPGTRIP